MTRFQNEHLWHWLFVYFFAWNENNPKTFSFHNSTLYCTTHVPSFTSLFHFFLLWNTISFEHFVLFLFIFKYINWKLVTAHHTRHTQTHVGILSSLQSGRWCYIFVTSPPDYITKAKSIYQMKTVFIIIMGE